MAKADIEQRMEALRGTNAGLILAEFFKHRLEERTREFLRCSKENFDLQRGRCHELESLIAFIEKGNRA